MRLVYSSILICWCAGVVGCMGGSTNGGVAAHTSETVTSSDGLAWRPLHRLTRVEMNHTVRDLLGTAQTPGDNFPPEVSGDGFDNDSDTQGISSTLLSIYETAAESLAAEASDANQSAYARVVTCSPSAPTCLTDIAQTFGSKAWRRPLTAAEAQHLASLAKASDPNGLGFQTQLNGLLIALLFSPNFIFRIEPVVPDGYTLASRLSYFLWASTPDDTLLQHAASGLLNTDAGLDAEVERMLTDAKAAAIGASFAGQWLGTQALSGIAFNAAQFPQYNTTLSQDMLQETQVFFTSLINNQAPLTDLVAAPYSYVNADLATFYGLPSPSGQGFTRVDFPATFTRRGVLMQAAVLAATSYPVRSSAIRRGVSIMGKVLCIAPPPPPAGVGALPTPTGAAATQRQLLAAHVTNPTCASCHNTIDPLGLAYENFDAIGAWRTADNGQTIDPSGIFDGQAFADAVGLTHIIATDPRFTACAVKNLYFYALARGSTMGDTAALDTLTSQFTQSGLQLRDLIHQIVRSQAFRAPATLSGATP